MLTPTKCIYLYFVGIFFANLFANLFVRRVFCRYAASKINSLIKFAVVVIQRSGIAAAACLQEHWLFGEVDYLNFGGGVCFLFHLFVVFFNA